MSLRVLSVIHPFRPEFTGEGEWWLRMVEPLRARGIAVEILTTRPSGSDAPESERVEGVAVRRVPLAGERPYWERMRAVLGTLARRRGSFEIALFHSPNYDTVYPACVLGRLLGWKTVYRPTLTGSDDIVSIRRTGRFGAARVLALRLAHGYVCLSEAVSRSFAEAGLRPRRLVTIPQGVDTERFRPADEATRREARRRLGIDARAPVALFCGSLMARKGVDILAAAWRRLAGERGDAVLLLVGPNHADGLVPPEDRAFARAIENELAGLVASGSVRLLGYRRDVTPYYAAADVFVLPSRAEGWANVVNEAMACGLPCVVSATCREQVRDGEEGYVVAGEDPDRYTERLRELLFDAELSRRMGGQGRRRTLEHQALGRIADRLAAFLHAVGREHARSGPVRAGAVP